MRVTIKGLTDCTITFNTIGIIVRGNSSNPILYPHSIARNIDIKTEEQMRELISLKNAKLISYVDESDESSKIVKVEPSNLNAISVSSGKENDDIEDMPSKSSKIETPVSINKTVKEKKPIGRPKKNVAVIKKIKPKYVLPEAKETEDDSKIVVMTPNGAVSGKTIKNAAGEIPEGDSTKASIDALKQLEEEEMIPESAIDESKLSAEERMGMNAIIATGNSKMAKVSMKNSILPEADSIKNRGIKFIDSNPDSDSDDSTSDSFIEI